MARRSVTPAGCVFCRAVPIKIFYCSSILRACLLFCLAYARQYYSLQASKGAQTSLHRETGLLILLAILFQVSPRYWQCFFRKVLQTVLRLPILLSLKYCQYFLTVLLLFFFIKTVLVLWLRCSFYVIYQQWTQKLFNSIIMWTVNGASMQWSVVVHNLFLCFVVALKTHLGNSFFALAKVLLQVLVLSIAILL